MTKRPADAEVSDDGLDEERSSVAPKQAKRSKTKDTSMDPAATSGVKPHRDENGDEYWDLNDKGTRRVTVSEFKGMKLIGVREFYESGGKMLPGKKGISMTLEQFSTLIEKLPQIEEALAKRGERVPRPVYEEEGSAAAPEQAEKPRDTSKLNDSKEKKKQNFEETSSEEDGE